MPSIRSEPPEEYAKVSRIRRITTASPRLPNFLGMRPVCTVNHQNTPMDLSPQSTRLQRLQERLNNSKYWSLSLAIHAVAITALSTLVLVKNAPTEDFIPEAEL